MKQQQIATNYQANKSTDEKDQSIPFFSSPKKFLCFCQDPITNLCVKSSRTLLCSSCADRTLKMFDVLAFDMIAMVKLEFLPLVCQFVHSSRQTLSTLAVSDTNSPSIYLYDGRTFNIKEPIAVLTKLGHSSPVSIISYVPKFDLAISIDQ